MFMAVVLVFKPKGNSRFCIDFRKVNVVTQRDSYLLPRITDIGFFNKSKEFYNLRFLYGILTDRIVRGINPKNIFNIPNLYRRYNDLLKECRRPLDIFNTNF